jgi:hypothetical protein
VSLDQIPPSRYRVIERDRILITIDTHTGLELGQRPPVKLSADNPLQPAAGPARSGQSALNAAPRSPNSSTGVSNDRTARVMMLVVAVVFSVVVLIVTSLWIPVVIALIIPPVRAAIWTAGKAAVGKFLAGG